MSIHYDQWHFQMRLTSYLILVVFITTSLCLLSVSAYTLLNAHQYSQQQFQQAENSALNTLQNQVIRIATGFEYIKRLPDFIFWDEMENAPGVCISFLAYHSNQRAGRCRAATVNQTWPDWFETLYWQLFSPQPDVTHTISYAQKSYGELSISQSEDVQISNAWEAVHQLMSYSLILLVSLSVLLFLTIGFALRPLKLINLKLKQISQQDLNPSIPKFMISEWNETALTVNQMINSLRSSRADNQQLLLKLINVQEDERKYLARELHDQLGQSLAGLTASHALLDKLISAANSQPVLAKAITITHTMQQQLRDILDHLKPTEIESFGLQASLMSLVQYWNLHTPHTYYHIEMTAAVDDIPASHALHIFRIIQEAVTNIARHANAKKAIITLSMDNDSRKILLHITDDGHFIDTQSVSAGHGLTGIKERVNAMGGIQTLSPNPTGGMRIDITIPLPPSGQ